MGIMSSLFSGGGELNEFGGHSSMFMAQEGAPRPYHNKTALGHWLQVTEDQQD